MESLINQTSSLTLNNKCLYMTLRYTIDWLKQNRHVVNEDILCVGQDVQPFICTPLSPFRN